MDPKKIKQEVLKAECNIQEIKFSNKKRDTLITWYFFFLQNLNIEKVYIEKSLILMDRIHSFFDFDISFQKILLVSLLNICFKLYSFFNKIQTDEILQKLNSESSNSKVLVKQINIGEIFLLNALEWDLNILTILNYIEYFILKYLPTLFKEISKESFYLWIHYFLEFTLCTFNTLNLPLHSIAISLMLLSYQHSTQYLDEKINQVIINFLDILNFKYCVDLLVVDHYQKFLTKNLNKLIKKEASKIHETNIILRYFECKYDLKNNRCVNYKINNLPSNKIKNKKSTEIVKIKIFQEKEYFATQIIINQKNKLSKAIMNFTKEYNDKMEY